MKRCLAVALLAFAAGCNEPPTKNGESTSGQSTDGPVTTNDEPVNASAPRDAPVPSYPEKQSVERLLARAAKLESEGKFQSALQVANEAVAVDPDSPRAAEVKQRLEDLVRRIEAADVTP